MEESGGVEVDKKTDQSVPPQPKDRQSKACVPHPPAREPLPWNLSVCAYGKGPLKGGYVFLYI